MLHPESDAALFFSDRYTGANIKNWPVCEINWLNLALFEKVQNIDFKFTVIQSAGKR